MEEELELLYHFQSDMSDRLYHIDKDNYEYDYLVLRNKISLVKNIIAAIKDYALISK